MSGEVAFLEIRVGGQGVTEARDRLRQLTEQSERSEKAAKKLADETERAEARKAKAVTEAAAKADKALTTMAINEGKSRERMATDAARYAAKMEAATRKQEQLMRDTGARQYAEVKKWLMTEEEALRESYLRRRSIIMSQGSGSMKQMDLAAMDYKYNQQLLTLRGSRLDSSKYSGTGPGMKSPSAFMGGASDAVTALAAGGGIQALTSTLIRFAPAAAAAAASYAVVNKALGESSAYKTAILQLSATTDGVENATRAYEALDAMEEEIPVGAEEMARSFSRLVNAGLDPSTKSIRSMAEIALGTGNSLEDVTEKVTNATMGNFRGLRELGIRAEENGAEIQMTFRGVTTSIGNDSKSIQSYLNNLGKTAFSGSIAKEMDSLDGSIFQLKDAWNDMFRDIGKGNIGPVIKDMVDTAKGAVDLLSSALKSEALGDAIAGLKIGFVEVAGAAHKAAGFTKWLFTGDTSMSKSADETTAAIKRQILEERNGEKSAKDMAGALKDANKEIDAQGKIVDKTADSLGRYAKMADGSSTTLAAFNQSMEDANVKFAESEENRREQEAKTRAQKEKEEFAQLVEKLRAEEDQIAVSYFKRQALIDKKTKKKPELREELTTQNYTQYQTEMANTKAAKAKEAQEKEAASLKEAKEKEIRTIEESLEEKFSIESAAYERKRALVIENVEDETRAEKILSNLAQKEAERRLAIQDDAKQKALSRQRQKEDLFTPYQSEIEQIKLTERRKLEEYKKARDEDILSEQEYQFLKAKLHRETETKITENDMRNKEAIAGNSAALFGNLAQVSKNLGGEQSAAYRGLFAVSKAFSIAQATMSIATGTAKALELGWPAGLAAGIQVAAQGAGLLAQITSSNYSGAYDQGGIIPAGRIGIVGERGPEFVQGPAMVTGRQQTAQILNGQSQAGSGQVGRITIISAPDTRGAYEFARSASGDRVFMNGVKRNASTIRQLLGVTG